MLKLWSSSGCRRVFSQILLLFRRCSMHPSKPKMLISSKLLFVTQTLWHLAPEYLDVLPVSVWFKRYYTWTDSRM